MEQVKKLMMPIAGSIQHGEQLLENNKKRIIDYGYFIAKVKNDNLKYLENRFNEKYVKQNSLTIRIIDEDPFTVKLIRYNQGGTACYCIGDNQFAKQKVSNKWTEVKCLESCQYREIPEGQSKPACKREAVLKFMLPEINSDRIWLMNIRGQTAIDNLDRYFSMQKVLGNSLIGDYKIFLYQKEQSCNGKKFYNFILDIAKLDEFISTNNSQIQSNTNTLSTNNTQNVENNAQNTEKIALTNQENKEDNNSSKTTENTDTDKKSTTKKTTKKATTEKKQKSSETDITKKQDTSPKQEEKNTVKTENDEEDFSNYYVLIKTKKQQGLKDGKPTEYVIGEFSTIDDKVLDVFIPHNLADELLECDIGTTVIMDLQKAGEKTFTTNIEYYTKIKKNIAA